MRKAGVFAIVGAAYTLLLGILLVLVLAVTTAVADGWKLRERSGSTVDRAPQFSRGGARVFRVGADGGAARPADGALGPVRRTSRGRTVLVRKNHLYLRYE